MTKTNTKLSTKITQEQLLELKSETGESIAPTKPKTIKYNANEGKFYVETEEKDEDNKSIFKEIGDKIQVQICKAFNQVRSGFNEFDSYFSDERSRFNFNLYDRNNNGALVSSGRYAVVRDEKGNDTGERKIGDKTFNGLKFQKNLYVFYDNDLHKMYLGGAKSFNANKYLNSFASNDSFALYNTAIEKGIEAKNGGVKYFEINFKKEKSLDVQDAFKNVRKVTEYIDAYNKSIENQKKENNQSETDQVAADFEAFEAQREEPPLPEFDK